MYALGSICILKDTNRHLPKSIIITKFRSDHVWFCCALSGYKHSHLSKKEFDDAFIFSHNSKFILIKGFTYNKKYYCQVVYDEEVELEHITANERTVQYPPSGIQTAN